MIINKTNILKQFDILSTVPKSICVALSGGADSVCLLHILKEVFNNTQTNISALHVNHNLRGEESLRDEKFCVELCEKLYVPLTVKNVFVNENVKKGESTELAARRLRYEAFEENHAEFIATAHNADDSLETFLINFSRGSGLKGLIGIPNIRDRFIRPLLKCSKEDILEYISKNNLEYITDSSNLTDDYTRNKIRHNVIPEIKKIYPEIVEVSARNFESLRNDDDFLNKESKKLFDLAYTKNQGLKVKEIVSAHKALSLRVICQYAFLITNRIPDSYHLNLMLDMCEGKSTYENLFSGYSAKVNKGYLIIETHSDFYFTVETNIVSKEKFENMLKINNLLLKNAIDYDKIIGELTFRTRLPKDKIRPFGRGISKSIRKLQNEEGVEKDLRDIMPLATDEKSLIWGFEIGIDDRVSIDQNTNNVLIFKVYKHKNGGQ